MDCYNLREFEIFKNVETIGAGAFVGTVNLGLSVHNENIDFEYYDNVLYSKDDTVLYWYNDCDSLRTSFVIPATVKIIEEEAFSSCKWLKKLTISSSVIEIKALAFVFLTPQCPNEVIFEITEGWICTKLEELGADIYEPTSEYLEESDATALWNYSVYNWRRTALD